MASASLRLDAILTRREREYQKAVPSTQGHLRRFPERRNRNGSRRKRQRLTLRLPITAAQDSARQATADGISLS